MPTKGTKIKGDRKSLLRARDAIQAERESKGAVVAERKGEVATLIEADLKRQFGEE